MEIKLIEERIKDYRPTGKDEELNAFKEIVQEITLSALSRSEFFKHAAFQGDTCLRIVHGLNRFSEDLDFVLYKADAQFEWNPFFREMELEFSGYGLQLEVKDRSKASDIVKKAFLKKTLLVRY
jgi:predicted nucleotidyltransferase component of viral defense system